MQVGPPTLRERVARAILESAAGVLATRGEDASISDVAAAAGLARATVYRYFPNRQALLEVGNYLVVLEQQRVRPDTVQFDAAVAQPLQRLFERGQQTAEIRGDIP